MRKLRILIVAITFIFALLAVFGLNGKSGESSHSSSSVTPVPELMLSEISGDSILSSVKVLSSEKSRRITTEGASNAVAFITGMLIRFGWNVENQEVGVMDHSNNSGVLVNIIARLPGSAGDGSMLVLCTHYDSRGEGPDDDAPGADDNASGAAVLLEVARVLSSWDVTRLEPHVRLVFLGGGEDSFLGSSSFVENLRHKDMQLIGAINIDMVGYDKEGPKGFVIFTNSESQFMAGLLQACSSLYTRLRCETIPAISANSDHLSFWNAGLPAVSVWEGYDHNPYYHTSSDTPEKLNPGFMEAIARVISCAVIKLGGWRSAPASASGSTMQPNAGR